MARGEGFARPWQNRKWVKASSGMPPARQLIYGLWLPHSLKYEAHRFVHRRIPYDERVHAADDAQFPRLPVLAPDLVKLRRLALDHELVMVARVDVQRH